MQTSCSVTTLFRLLHPHFLFTKSDPVFLPPMLRCHVKTAGEVSRLAILEAASGFRVRPISELSPLAGMVRCQASTQHLISLIPAYRPARYQTLRATNGRSCIATRDSHRGVVARLEACTGDELAIAPEISPWIVESSKPKRTFHPAWPRDMASHRRQPAIRGHCTRGWWGKSQMQMVASCGNRMNA